jgi:glutathione S-transferase
MPAQRFTVGEKLTIATLLLAAVVWAVRLEGRVNANERAAGDAITLFREDLKYIRDRIDRALEAGR